MSTLKVNNLQVGQDSTATNNLTWFQPGSPDGTIRLGSGNAGSATTKFTFDKDGNLTCVGDITANSIIAPIEGTLDDWIVHAGDTNTKFGFPAADTFSVETAGQQNVQVNGTRTLLTSPSGTNTTLRLQHQGNSGYGDIILDRTVNAFIIDNDPNNAGSNGTYFSVKNKGTENLRITHDGKVGINQVSPDGMLHIWSATAGSVSADADADELVLENSGNVGLSLLTAGTGESSIYFGNPGTNGQKDAWIKYYHESHSTTANRRGLSFKTGGGSEKMKLDHAGRLLIGRESAYAHVDADNLIVGNEATNEHQGITILTHSGKYGGIYFGDGHNPNGHNRCKIIYDHPNDQFRIGTAGNSNQFYLDASGHMGLGISPSDVDSIGRALNIASSTGGAIYLQDTDAPTTKFAAISYNGGTAGLQIHAHHGSSYIDLGTNGTERLRINSSGKTILHGSGATGSNNTATILENGNTLNIHGTSSSDGISVVRYSANYGAYGLNIGKSRNNTFGTNTLVQDGNELGHISFYGADGTDFEMAAQITGLVDGDPATGGDGTDMPGALSFRTTPEGSDGVTERFRISANGRVAVGNATNNANTNALFKAVADDGEAADLYVGHFINLEATAGQSYGVNIQAGSNSTDHGFRVRNRANNTTQFLVRGDGQALFDRGAPASANKTIARFQAESSRKLDIVWHDSGSLMGFDTPGNHAYIFKANGSEKVRFQTSYGGVLVNSCQRWQWGGSAACNTTWSVQFTPLTGGGGGNIYHIKAYFSHHSLSYGAYLEGVYGAYAGHTGLQIDNDENSSNSSAGGSWDVTRASSGSNPPVVITHTAGTYNGSGHWFVWVIAGHQ